MNENVTDPEHWLEFRIIVVAILEKSHKKLFTKQLRKGLVKNFEVRYLRTTYEFLEGAAWLCRVRRGYVGCDVAM
jgi:hypothetical protein